MIDLSSFLPPLPLPRTEVFTIAVDGTNYTAFERIQVRASFKEAARAFQVRIAAELSGAVTAAIFHAGAEVSVMASGDLLMQGYVDEYRPHIADRAANIDVRGRSKSGDLIDSDVDHETGFFENKDPLEIGNALAQGYGAQFETDQQLEKITPNHLVTPGESIYRSIEKLARRQGMTLTGTPEGNIKITKPNGERHAGGLFEGQNILVGNADHNWSNRHSQYIVKGQRPVGHGSRVLHMMTKTPDSAVTRLRKKSVISDDDTTIDQLKKRGENRRNRAAGNSLQASISTAGLRDQGGKLWTPGFLVWTESPFLNIAQDMLVEAVDYSQSNHGTIALLSLVDPRAYDGKGGGGGKGNKSGSEYKIDNSPATDETPGP